MLFCGKFWFQAADEMYARAPGVALSSRQVDAKIGPQSEPLSLLCPTVDQWNSPSLGSKRLTARNLECGFYCWALNKFEVGNPIRY
jgi:hypothetical protein